MTKQKVAASGEAWQMGGGGRLPNREQVHLTAEQRQALMDEYQSSEISPQRRINSRMDRPSKADVHDLFVFFGGGGAQRSAGA